MTPSNYRLSYTRGSDGKHQLAVEITGPLADPLAGLMPEDRRGVMAVPRTWSEIRLLFESFRLPPLARQAVENHVLASRRQRYEALKLAARPATAVPAAVQRHDAEPHM